ncbi:PD-(D/E)XK nuclease-like domain-containing protein, partial [Stieleria sp.]|uniref:PD-(D/E)XK nuclease-like domain-containing protein n=1 Tax=Stieleria sp. TaxID=2795976 RepID=UPI003563E034
VEHSIRCDDAETGVPCKIRCDKAIIDEQHPFVVDIKTVSEWSERKFAYACEDFGYHIQAAHYASIASQHYEIDLPLWSVVFAVVETQAPYRARACILDAESIQKGFAERYSLLCEYQDRMTSGDWSEKDEHELTEIVLPSVYRKRGSHDD